MARIPIGGGTVHPDASVVHAYFHGLILAWAQDRHIPTEIELYRGAVPHLAVCGKMRAFYGAPAK
jgi:hypothetical protein